MTDLMPETLRLLSMHLFTLWSMGVEQGKNAYYWVYGPTKTIEAPPELAAAQALVDEFSAAWQSQVDELRRTIKNNVWVGKDFIGYIKDLERKVASLTERLEALRNCLEAHRQATPYSTILEGAKLCAWADVVLSAEEGKHG